MFGHYDLKNLFHAPTSAPPRGQPTLEAVRTRIADTVSKIKQAVKHNKTSRSAEALAPHSAAVTASAQQLLATLRHIEHARTSPSAAQSLALSRATGPLFSAWDRAAPSLQYDWTATKVALEQVRSLVQVQEVRLFDALAASRKQSRPGSPQFRQASQALSELSGTAVNPAVRQQARRLGVSPTVSTSSSDRLSPATALDLALRVATAQARSITGGTALRAGLAQQGAPGVATAAGAQQAAATARKAAAPKAKGAPPPVAAAAPARLQQPARPAVRPPIVANAENNSPGPQGAGQARELPPSAAQAQQILHAFEPLGGLLGDDLHPQ